jgi:rhodanese-related sulfurtransferase
MKKILMLLFVILSFQIDAQISKDVDSPTFKSLIENKSGILIDLRTPDEIKAKGKIKGAIEIDYLAKDADEKLKQLDKTKTYFIYCAGGGRSGDCKQQMAKEGFKEVINLSGGIEDWKRKGFQIEKS